MITQTVQELAYLVDTNTPTHSQRDTTENSTTFTIRYRYTDGS